MGKASLRRDQRRTHGARTEEPLSARASRSTRPERCEPLGDAVRLRYRPIYITVDQRGEHVLSAFNEPSSVAVHSLAADGSIGAEVPQTATLDAGIYAHQIRVMPSGRAVIVPARGNEGIAGRKEEDRGALKIFGYENGQLTNRQSVAPNGGRGFRCRHVEFHPSGRWAYVVIESQNELHTYRIADDRLSPEPVFVTSVLAAATRSQPGQAASAIRVHPSGGTLYVANRGRGKEVFRGEEVISEDMENSIAVFSVDADTGEPRLIQSADPQSLDVRMFALHPDGRSLVATSHESAGPIKRRKATASRSCRRGSFCSDRGRRPIDVPVQAGRADRRRVSALVRRRSVLSVATHRFAARARKH